MTGANETHVGGGYGECNTWKWSEIPSGNPIGGRPVPRQAGEPVGSVKGAISRDNDWRNHNGELKNGVDIRRGWSFAKKNLWQEGKKKRKETKNQQRFP